MMKDCTIAYLAELDRCDAMWREEIAQWKDGTHPLIAIDAKRTGFRLTPEVHIAILEDCIASHDELRPVIRAEKYGQMWNERYPGTEMDINLCCPWGNWNWCNYVSVMAAFDADPEGFESRLGPIELIKEGA